MGRNSKTAASAATVAEGHEVRIANIRINGTIEPGTPVALNETDLAELTALDAVRELNDGEQSLLDTGSLIAMSLYPEAPAAPQGDSTDGTATDGTATGGADETIG